MPKATAPPIADIKITLVVIFAFLTVSSSVFPLRLHKYQPIKFIPIKYTCKGISPNKPV